jgi:hypothetical protein
MSKKRDHVGREMADSPTPVKLGGMAPGNTVDNVNRVADVLASHPTHITRGRPTSESRRRVVRLPARTCPGHEPDKLKRRLSPVT